MLRIYIAGPLFSKAEREYNKDLNKFLKELGFDTFLPQHDGHELSELLTNGVSKSMALSKIFIRDIDNIQKSDIVVLVMDGRVPDEGACVEVGYAYALGKECIGLKTDPRTLISDLNNPMIVGTLKNRIAKNLKELESFLIQVKEKRERKKQSFRTKKFSKEKAEEE